MAYSIMLAGQDMFQSQTRSRSTCDVQVGEVVVPVTHVSISDEKPLHMRLGVFDLGDVTETGFNLRREAAPHATRPTPSLPVLGSDVSISDEKPLHMRLRRSTKYPAA